MKPFNIKEHLEHPDWKVVTRDGHPARIICTDRKGSNQPILALVQVRADPIEVALTFGTDGTYDIGRESCYDLFFAPEKHERWAIIYKRPLAGSFEIWPGIYADREKAERIREVNLVGAKCSVIKIEWEEEQ